MDNGKRFLILGLALGLAALCFVHIDSYVADKHGLNPMFIFLGIVFTVIGAVQLVKLLKDTPPKNRDL